GDKVAAMKLAAAMFVFVVVLVALEKSTRRGGRPSELSVESSSRRIELRGTMAVTATIVCGIPVFLGAVLPLSVLLYLTGTTGDPLWGEEFLDFATNSVFVSVLAAAVSIIVALALTFGQHLAPHWLTKGAAQFATLGYALPGTLLAVGLLPPILALDRGLADWLIATFDWRAGLLLTGSVFVLVYAYVVRFLTVAYNTTSSAIGQIPRSYVHAARTLGATPLETVRKIHTPLMLRASMTATLLVFVDTMRELPATLILRPFNFETLATRVYRLAADERLGEASTAALAIVLIGLIPVLLIHRQMGKR
ncbi:MAG: ABC transporter permease subunit, partial [Myxococcota bacterium]